VAEARQHGRPLMGICPFHAQSDVPQKFTELFSQDIPEDRRRSHFITAAATTHDNDCSHCLTPGQAAPPPQKNTALVELGVMQPTTAVGILLLALPVRGKHASPRGLLPHALLPHLLQGKHTGSVRALTGSALLTARSPPSCAPPASSPMRAPPTRCGSASRAPPQGAQSQSRPWRSPSSWR